MMSGERKLRRGLPELSPLFVKPAGGDKSTVVIERPEICEQRSEDSLRLICAAFLPVGESFQVGDEILFLEALSTTFREKYFVTVAPQYQHYEVLSRHLPIPVWEHIVAGEAIRVQSLGDSTHFAYISEHKFEEVLRLRPTLGPPVLTSEEKALLLFDSASLETAQRSVISLLDHVVLVLSPATEHVLEGYELLQQCLKINPNLRFSILIVGKGAGSLCDFVFEHFSKIVSQFLGYDVGLLGWSENGDLRLNPYLLEESKSAAQSSVKARLKQVLGIKG